MVTINASPERNIRLGYAGEDKVTKVIFPYDESWLEYGDGEFFIRVLRPGDTEPYNAQDVTNDSEAMTLTLVVTDVELSRQGYGQMQVVYIGPQVVKKSRIYAYRVSKAIDEPVDPPDGSIINQIVQSLGDLSDLTTTAKRDLVSAINEVNAKGSVVTVSGMTPTITALSGVRYVCGEVATLDFTPCATGICDVVFTSGSTPTVVTLPNTVKFPDGSFTAEANKTYEINILDGVYGVVMSWT